MATYKILMQTAQVQKLVDYFDGYSDEKITSCKFMKKAGIKAEMEVVTDLPADVAAEHLKKVFKGTKEGSYMYFSIQPDGFFG